MTRDVRSDPPAAIGPYRIVREIGRGGMAVVHEARREGSPATVALKVQRFDKSSDLGREFLERFRLETRIVRTLQHPNIVRVLDSGESGEHIWMAMEMVDGEPLHRHLQIDPLDPRRAVRIALEIASALACAHDRGILHRDVKPANILIDRSGRARLVDFGLAKVTSADRAMTPTGAYLGTPGYTSPEQATGAIQDLDPRTDVFGLGSTLYEMLAGRCPFAGRKPNAILANVLSKEPEPPDRQNPHVPTHLSALVLSCLSKDKGGRPKDGHALARELERCLAAFEAQGEAERAETILEPGRRARAVDDTLPAIPGFEIRREISRGGMGVVFLAHQKSLGRDVALKVLREGRDASPDAIERFAREARAAGSLSHPNIVPIHDMGRSGDLWYFTMDYVPGKPLSEYLRDPGVSPIHAVEIAIGIAGALDYLNGKGILHRDLKPANVLMDESKQPRLVDFGLAKNLADPGGAESVEGRGDPALHGAGAGEGGHLRDRRAHRHLRPGRDPLRDGDGATADGGEDSRRDPRPDPDRTDQGPPRAQAVPGSPHRRPLHEGPRAREERPVEIGGRAPRAPQGAPCGIERADGDGGRGQGAAAQKGREKRRARTTEGPAGPAAAPPQGERQKAPVPDALHSERRAGLPRGPWILAGGALVVILAVVIAFNSSRGGGSAPPGSPAIAKRLALRSVPAGGLVRIDGAERGKTPLDLFDVPVGSRRISVAKERYGKIEETLELGAEGATRDFVLAPPGMVYVPAGAYWSGIPEPEADRFRNDEWIAAGTVDRFPPRRVDHVAGFFIDTHEVSNAEYKRFVEASNHPAPPGWTGAAFPAGQEECPVAGVTFRDTVAYCDWAGRRLPTAQEWEKAARGVEGWPYPWGPAFEEGRANAVDAKIGNALSRHHPLVEKDTSPFGIHAACGNVMEWTGTSAPVDGNFRYVLGLAYNFRLLSRICGSSEARAALQGCDRARSASLQTSGSRTIFW